MVEATIAKRPYESMFICPSDTQQATIDGFIEKIKNTVTQNQGEVKGVQVWGRRRLAYPIGHHRDGIYIYVEFSGGSSTANQLSNLYRVSDLIVRHLTVVKEDPAGDFAASGSRRPPSSSEGTEKSKSPSQIKEG
jgi:small subunit ribosomal protein S6